MPFLSQREATNKEKSSCQAWASFVVAAMLGAERHTSILYLPSPWLSITSQSFREGSSLLREHWKLSSITCSLPVGHLQGSDWKESNTALSPWQLYDRTGNKKEKATGKKQAISKEEQKHFRDVCYFPLLSLSPHLTHTHSLPPTFPIIIIIIIVVIVVCCCCFQLS